VLDDASDALEQVKMAARRQRQSVDRLCRFDRVPSDGGACAAPFREDYPGVKIRTEESNAWRCSQAGGRQVDCAMVRLPLDCGDAIVTPLVQEKMIAVLPSGHALGRRRSIDLKQLAGDPFILYPRAINPELHDAIISACRAAGFSPAIGMESPQISSGVNMAAAGFGVAIVPESIGQFRAEGVTCQNISNKDLGTAIALITRPREKSVTVKNFTELVKQFHRR
jgi:DNA-binding transcriptional LysR family regulator